MIRSIVASIVTSLALVTPSIANDRQYDPSTFTWNPELSPSGPVLVTVSLKSETAAVYRNGIKIGSCEISAGRKGHETPTGVFHILNKDADHRSKTYGNAPMPYSERLTWDGVALHAGALPGYPSSHGCIHLPYDFSKKLFEVTHKGSTVVVTNDTPDVHVSSNHSIDFQKGESTDFIWTPQKSPEGPVSLLFSKADKKLFVIRDGVTIGECPVKTGFFSKKPKGTSAFVFTGWKGDKGSWHYVGGDKANHSTQLSEWFKLDERFQHILHGVVVPGTNLVVTSESVSKKTRSEPGFRVLQGAKEEAAD